MTGLVLVIQSRMESVRFPGKALANLGGQPLLLHVLDRASQVPLSHTLLVATPDTPPNLALHDLCARHGYQCLAVPGDPADVLARYAHAAAHLGADVIVRICGDTPLLSPEVITKLILCREWAKADYARLAPEWGDGWDVGVFTRAALIRAHAEATIPSDLEHVEPYLARESSGFKVVHLPCPYDLSWFRGSVDTREDLHRVERLLTAALDGGLGPQPDWRTLAALCEHSPRHKEAMRRKPLNQAYADQVAAEEEGGMTPEEREAYRRQFPDWHDAQGNYIPDSARKAEAR